MEEKNASIGFSLKKYFETINYFFEEIKHNELISKMHKKTGKTLNYIDVSLWNFIGIDIGVSISSFTSYLFLWELQVLQLG